MHTRDRSEQELEVYRFRAMKEETTDPIAFRFLEEIVSELEADLEKNTEHDAPA